MRIFFLVLAIISGVIFLIALARVYFPGDALEGVDAATHLAKLALLATVGTYLKSLDIARQTKP